MSNLLNTLFANTPALNSVSWVFLHSLEDLSSSLIEFIFYLFQFKWVSDLASFSVIIPFNPNNFVSIANGDFEYSIPLEESKLSYASILFQGLITSVLISLPSSPARLLALRQWIVRGPWLGSATLIGVCLTQFTFITSTVFGIAPSLHLIRSIYPIWFIFGSFCLISQLQQLIPIYGSPVDRVHPNNSFDRQILVQSITQGVILGAFEQTNIIPYLNNLVIGTNVFQGEGFSGLTSNIIYTTGFGVGLIVCGIIINSILASLLTIKFSIPVRFYSTYGYTRGIQVSRILTLSLLISSFVSLPYYSALYLASQPLNLAPYESAKLSNELGWLVRGSQANVVSSLTKQKKVGIIPPGLWNRSLVIFKTRKFPIGQKTIKRRTHNWRMIGNFLDIGFGPGTKRFPSLSNFPAEILLDKTAYRTYILSSIDQKARHQSDQTNLRKFRIYKSPWFTGWKYRGIKFTKKFFGKTIKVSINQNNTEGISTITNKPLNEVIIENRSRTFPKPKIGGPVRGDTLRTKFFDSQLNKRNFFAPNRSLVQRAFDDKNNPILNTNSKTWNKRTLKKDLKNSTNIFSQFSNIQVVNFVLFPIRLIYGLFYQIIVVVLSSKVFLLIQKLGFIGNRAIPGQKLIFEGSLPSGQASRGIRRWIIGREHRIRRNWLILRSSTKRKNRGYFIYASRFNTVELLRQLLVYKSPTNFKLLASKKGLALSEQYNPGLNNLSFQTSKSFRAVSKTLPVNERRENNIESISSSNDNNSKNESGLILGLTSQETSSEDNNSKFKFKKELKSSFYQASGRKLGHDPLPELNQTWATIKWIENQQNYLDKKISLRSKNFKISNYIGISSNINEKITLKNKSNQLNAQIGLRREIQQLSKIQKSKFNKLHDQWVERSFVKSRFEPWTAAPSEEQMIWILSRVHPQLVGSTSETIFNLLTIKKQPKNRRNLSNLEAKSILRPRKQANWSWGLDKLTQGDRLQHARQLEREIKAISPNLLRYNRYLQINRDLVYLHKENLKREINNLSSKSNWNEQIQINPIHPIKDKLNLSNSAISQRRLFNPITNNFSLLGTKLLSPSIYEPYSIDQIHNNSDNSIKRKEWFKQKNRLNSRILPYSNLQPYNGFISLLGINYEPSSQINPVKNNLTRTNPSILGSFKTQRIAKNIKRWAMYQEIVGEREINTSHKKWGRTRKTKGLRVVRFGHPNPYLFQTHSDFKSQSIPKAFGRRRVRSSIYPSYADWQFENKTNSNPMYKKLTSTFGGRKQKKSKTKARKILKSNESGQNTSDQDDSRKKERRLVENLEKSFRKKSRRNEANLGDRIGWINNQLSFSKSENITLDDINIDNVNELNSTNNIKFSSDPLENDTDILSGNDFNWSNINKRTERAKIATRRRSDLDWERASFSNQFEQLGNRPPVFTKTTQNDRKIDRRLIRPVAPLAATYGDTQSIDFLIGLIKSTSSYIHGLPLVVDKILSGQTNDHFITPIEEYKLLQRKNQLVRYYDSIREYQKSNNWRRFVPGGSRSWVDNVYNHQFKGTLTTVRRLFYITPLESQNINNTRVFKYNQLLYDRKGENYNPSLHEELGQIDSKRINQPWIELVTNPGPFYAGWDAVSNSVILTTKSIPKTNNNLPKNTITTRKTKFWEIYKNSSIQFNNSKTEKILDWPNYALTRFNGFFTKTFQPTRLERYHFITSFNKTFSIHDQSLTLIELINQIRLKNQLSYGTLDLVGPWINPWTKRSIVSGESNRYLIRSSVNRKKSLRGTKSDQIKNLKEWFNTYREYPTFAPANQVLNNQAIEHLNKRTKRHRFLHSIGSIYPISGPNKNLDTVSNPYVNFDLYFKYLTTPEVNSFDSNSQYGLNQYPESTGYLLPNFILQHTQPLGTRTQWNKSTKYPQNIINYNARQQSNRSVSDSLMWQKLAGCRYLTGGINLDVSETTNWIHRSRYLNKKSKQEFIKRWLKYRSNKNAETQMTMWYGSSRLRGLRNIQSNSLPPQGKGPQDSGVWRLRRTRFKNTRRQLHGYNLYSEKK